MAERVDYRQARRAGAALAFLSLAACEIVPDPGAPETAAQIVRPAMPRGQESGVVAIRQRVALLVPLTGPDASIGRSIANAAELALSEGAGKAIELTTYDTAGGAAAAAREALAAGHRLLLGPLLAEDVRAAAPLARNAGVQVIAFSNDATVAGNGVYLLGFTPAQSVDRVITYARGQGVQRFAGLVPAGTYGERARQALVSAVQRSGGRLIAVETYPRTAGAARAAARRLAGPFEAVLIADSVQVAGEAAPAIRGGVRLLGTELWSAAPGLSNVEILRGAWFAAPAAGFDQLRPRYRARFGEEPYRLASLGYDAVRLTADLAGDWPAGRAFPEEALRGRGFAGVDGPFRFWRDGVADRKLDVLEIRSGGVTVVSPAGS